MREARTPPPRRWTKKKFLEWQELGKVLLAHKYRYYVTDSPLVSDYEYDRLEKKWLAMGAEVGRTRTPPFWVGFDWKHPFAGEVADLVRGMRR